MKSVLFALMIGCAALPCRAQDMGRAEDLGAATILASIAEAEQKLGAGDLDAGLALIFQANDLAVKADGMDPLVRFLPNLAAARAYRLRYDWPETERYAAATLRALDGAEHATHPMRLEAAGRLGQALLRQGRASEAAAILRQVLAQIDAAGGVTSAEAALVEFWLAATLTRMGGDGWDVVGARVMQGDLATALVSEPEFLSFVFDYAELLRAADVASEDLVEMTTLMAQMAQDPMVLDLDRAVYLEFHAQVLNDLGRTAEAAELMQAELARLEADRRGTQRYVAVGLRLALLWFEMGQITEGIAVLAQMQDEALPEVGPSQLGFIVTVRGRALDFLGQSAEAQAAYREGYALLRRELPAHATQALETASVISRDDPGFAGFAFAAELTDPATIALDGPAEAVLERFLSGLYAQNEMVLMSPDQAPDMAAWLRNRVLHLALSGRAGPLRTELAELRAAGLVQDADQLQLFEAIGAFWLTGRRPQDAPDLFAALDGLEARLPPDQASLVRALRLAALNFDGRTAEATALLHDWVAARDMTRQPRTVWDIAAGMIATELGWLFLPRDMAASVMADSLADVDTASGLGLARDYLQLVRLLNASGDMDSDRGLTELATLVQRISAQVPAGHILRATTRFGLANALAAQDRHAEAHTMMAEAIEAYRENPAHRADVLAFMQSLQAQSLSRTGRQDLGLNLARAAFEGLPPDARADYRLMIVMALAWELVAQGRAEDALTLTKAELSDPKLRAGLVPLAQVDLLRNRAGVHRDAGDLAGSDALLAEARDLLAENPDIPASYRAIVDWEQGLTHWSAGRLEPAFRSVMASNDVYVQMRREVAQESASGRSAMRAEDAMRARTEALIGWELAKTLRAQDAALP